MKVYTYKSCSTCVKAIKYLKAKNIESTEIPIRDTPPTKTEIKRMLTKYPLKRLFNTSGKDYRENNMKEKIVSWSQEKLINALNSNGNMVKRPFVVGDKVLLVGFKEEEWNEVFS